MRRDAWKSVEGTSKEEAQKKYAELLLEVSNVDLDLFRFIYHVACDQRFLASLKMREQRHGSKKLRAHRGERL